jgi:hypothetical protein
VPGTSWPAPVLDCGQHGRGRRRACHNRAVTPALMQRATLARLAAGPVALALAFGALAVAQSPGRFTTYAGRSGLAATLTVAAGLALVVAGLVTTFGRQARRIGDLALLAGLVWFAPVWVGWDRGPPLVRSLGMLAAGFTFPLLLHLVVAYPSGRLQGAAARTLVAAAYLEAMVAALGRALFRDPFFDPDCWANCSDNRSCCARSRALPARSRWPIAGLPWLPRPPWWPSAPGGCYGTRGRLAVCSCRSPCQPSCSRPRSSRTWSPCSAGRWKIRPTRPSA